MKHSNKRTIAGLMAMLMVLAVILSIPAMTMNKQVINDPVTNGSNLITELSIAARESVGYKYGIHFVFKFHEKGDTPMLANCGDTWYPEDDWAYQECLNEGIYGPTNIDEVEKINFDTFMESEDWVNIETMCYNYMNTMYQDYGWKGKNCVLDIEMQPMDYQYTEYHDGNRPAESTGYKYGFLDGIHTITLELPNDYVNPDKTPEPTPTPVVDQPPADNAATLAPKIQVDNKPMSVQHSVMTVTINGIPTELDAIVLTEAGGGAHTYYKLRDVGEKVGFDVGWTPETGITVSTD